MVNYSDTRDTHDYWYANVTMASLPRQMSANQIHVRTYVRMYVT